MNLIEFNKIDIEKAFIKAEGSLLHKDHIHAVNYTGYDLSSFDNNNQELLKSIAGKSIVYCIWTGKSKEDLNPKYIGHAKGSIARQRIRNHLTRCNTRTGAQLQKVSATLSLKRLIGLSFLVIEPDYMRGALEEWLIKGNAEKLEWNKIGRKR